MKGSGRRVPYISLTGSKSVCLQFRAFLEKELNEPMPPNIIFYKKSYLFMVSDHRAVKAIRLLWPFRLGKKTAKGNCNTEGVSR